MLNVPRTSKLSRCFSAVHRGVLEMGPMRMKQMVRSALACLLAVLLRNASASRTSSLAERQRIPER